ncbi:probable calcium-binding protein CML41 [Andrographis paniculata]|uniref:probable calcium-binding protein CML41 n=1 Tax=Andrographis paniculata TaxID=175694 RepID=UPI0021E74B24|nr:probable calcium-binding protein CML41 [Andrographis paniculata]
MKSLIQSVEHFCSFSPKKLLRRRPKSKSTSSGSGSGSGSPKSASTVAPPREEELREVFRRFDSDGDGKISALEIRSYFASVGEYMSFEDAQAIIEYLDGDSDDFLDFEDFVRLMVEEDGGGDREEDLRAAFGVFEMESGSGRITAAGLQRVLGKLGDPKSYDECAAMIRAFDLEGKGELGFHEFRQMMR